MNPETKKIMDQKVKKLKEEGWDSAAIARYKAKFRDVDAIKTGKKKNPYAG